MLAKPSIVSALIIIVSCGLALASEHRVINIGAQGIVITDGLVTATVESSDLRTVMTEIARQVPCSLYFDPAITNATSIKLSKQPIEKALTIILGSVNYLITWEPIHDPRAGDAYRVADIRVYRKDNPESAILTYTAEKEVSLGNPELDAWVARGNAAIPELSAKLTNSADAANAMLAADALAKIGTPESVKALFNGLATIENGDFKEEICKLASLVSSKAAAAALLEIMTTAEDRSLIRASEYALAHMMDSTMLSGFVDGRDFSQGGAGNERLLSLVRNLTSREAEDALITLAGPINDLESTPLTTAALSGLSRVGTATATDNLLQRLEAAPLGSSSDIFNAITQVSGSDESRAALQYAAAGNKQVSSDQTRIAAIHALGNYPDGQTRNLLISLAADTSEPVRQAAATILQRITIIE